MLAVSMALLVEYLPQFTAQGRDGVAAFVAQGRTLRFIRPSTRTQVRAPVLNLTTYAPLPPDLVLTRTPRSAERKCGSRKNTPN